MPRKSNAPAESYSRAKRNDTQRILVERPLPRDGAPAAQAARPGQLKRKGRMSRSVTVNLAESPLSWLLARGHVSPRQFQASEALRRDFEIAQLGPQVTMQWDAPPQGKTARGAPYGLDRTEAQLAAKQRFDEAMERLGPGLNDIAWRVVCAGQGLGVAEGALGWPVRAAKLVLGMALDRLVDFYRVPG